MKHPHLRDQIYLGDGLYCGHDGFQIWLYTSNGFEISNEVALDSNVQHALFRYLERIYNVTITVEKKETESENETDKKDT